MTARLALLTALLLATGCNGLVADDWNVAPEAWDVADEQLEQDAPGAPADDVVLHEDLVLVDDNPCVTSVDVPADREVLTFEMACDPVGHGLEPGRIVVGTEGGGYLRRIESVAFDGYTVTAWTTEADLAEVIVDGGFALSLDGSGFERALIDMGNTTLFAGEVAGSEVLVRLPTAEIDISPLIDIDGHWNEGQMERFDFDTSLEMGGDLSLYIHSSNGLRHGDSFDIWGTSWPFATAVGPLPVVGAVSLKVKVGYRVDSPGQLSTTTGVSGDVAWSSDRRWRQGEGWTEDSNHTDDLDVDFPDFDVKASATVKGYLRAELSVDFYGVVGPELQAELKTELDIAAGCDGIEWDVDAALVGRAMVKMNILDKFKPTKVFGTLDFTADVASGLVDWPVDFPVPCQQEEIRCGDLVEGDTSVLTAQSDGYDINVGSYAAPEAIYEFVAPADGLVEWSLVDAQPTVVNHDVFVLDGALGLVTGSALDWGHNSVEFEAVAGQSYYLVVDGYDLDSGPFAAALSCI